MSYYILFNANTGNYVIETSKNYDGIEYGRIQWYGSDTLRIYIKDLKEKDKYIETLKNFAIKYHENSIETLKKVK